LQFIIILPLMKIDLFFFCVFGFWKRKSEKQNHI